MDSENTNAKPRRGLFGCLFSGGMGCAAFLFGAVMSVALFAPTMLGDVVARMIQAEFHRHHDGRLVIEDLELSWARRQQARGVKLLDAEGEDVLVFEASFPSLLTILGVQDRGRDFEVEIDTARLVIGPEGGSNLEAAMADRGRAYRWGDALDASLIREPLRDGAAEAFASGELAWTSLSVRARPGAISVRDSRQALDPIELDALDFEVLAASGGNGDDELDSASRAVIQGTVGFDDGGRCRLDLSRVIGERVWNGVVEGTGVPTRLLGSLVGDRGRLDTLLGPDCDLSLNFTDTTQAIGGADEGPSAQRGPVHVTGQLAAAPAFVHWAFFVDGEQLTPIGDEPVLRISSKERGVLSAELTNWLFPWLDSAAEHEGPAPPTFGGLDLHLDLEAFAWRRGIGTLDGTVDVTLGQQIYPPIGSFADTLGLDAGQAFERQRAPIELQVVDGVLRYAGIDMSIEDRLCSFNGTHDLAVGRVDVEIEVPFSFLTRRMVAQEASEASPATDLRVPVRLVGNWRSPELDVKLSSFQEALNVNVKKGAESVLGGVLRALVPSDTSEASTGD